jgi:hypothetical protein
MSLQNHSQSFIRQSLGVTVLIKSFSCWTQLFHETQRAVRDPAGYKDCGRTSVLSLEEHDFMIELVCQEPSLFLDDIQERLYNHGGPLVGILTLHQMLANKLSITLKKPNTVKIRKSLSHKFRWYAKMANVPAEFLVFTGKLCLFLLGLEITI